MGGLIVEEGRRLGKEHLINRKRFSRFPGEAGQLVVNPVKL